MLKTTSINCFNTKIDSEEKRVKKAGRYIEKRDVESNIVQNFKDTMKKKFIENKMRTIF